MVRLMLILEILLQLKSKQGDVTVAFLHAELGENKKVYIEMPIGFRQQDEVLKLKFTSHELQQPPGAFWQYPTAFWEHYKPRLLTNGARVAYLCSPHPAIIAHSDANKDPLNNIAIEEFIRRVILPRRQTISEKPNVVQAKLVDKVWAERDNFVKRRGFFSRESIWITAGDPMTISYEWHKRYLVPATKVFGLSACLSCSLVLGCGQA